MIINKQNQDFPKPRHAAFAFDKWRVQRNTLELYYSLRGGEDPDIEFCEKITFVHALDNDSIRDLPPLDSFVVDEFFSKLCATCHLIFGISYYKAALPLEIICPALAPAEAEFFDILYSEGLGEFYFRNNLPIPQRQLFPRLNNQVNLTNNNNLPITTNAKCNLSSNFEKALILIGGGKDSALVSDIVSEAKINAEAISLGNSSWSKRSAQAAKLPLHRIERVIDPKLFQLNRRGAWNGHIPISAAITAITTLYAYCYGYSDVIAGNERGAEEATVNIDGIAYNHQWSKTFRFERLWQKYIDNLADGKLVPRYFSLLRPLSEIHIAAAFAKLPEHLANFTSCNSNFKQQNSLHPNRWCGKCPKCVFVYLLLAPFLSREQRQSIFDNDFLTDNYQHLLDLLGINPIKPWECVGTIEECRLALTKLYQQEELPADLQNIIVKWPEVLLDNEFEELWQRAFTLSEQHSLSPIWLERLHAYFHAN